MAFGFIPGVINYPRNIPTPGGFYRSVEIPENTHSTNDLLDYPFYIDIQNNSFKSVGNGGEVISATGNDILFYLDSDLEQLLVWDLVYWDDVIGRLVAWVKIPILTKAVPTTIYINYGNTNLDVNVYYGIRESVWISYDLVGHFGAGEREFYNSVNDSSFVAFGTGITQTTVGNIPYGISLNSTDKNSIDIGYFPTNAFTYSFMYKTIVSTTGMEIIGNYDRVGQIGTGVSLFDNQTTKLFFYADNQSNSDNNQNYVGVVNHITIIHDIDETMLYYLNGSLTKTLTNVTIDGTMPFLIGEFYNGTANFEGFITNLKIYKGKRTTNDILTEIGAINDLSPNIILGTETLYV